MGENPFRMLPPTLVWGSEEPPSAILEQPPPPPPLPPVSWRFLSSPPSPCPVRSSVHSVLKLLNAMERQTDEAEGKKREDNLPEQKNQQAEPCPFQRKVKELEEAGFSTDHFQNWDPRAFKFIELDVDSTVIERRERSGRRHPNISPAYQSSNFPFDHPQQPEAGESLDEALLQQLAQWDPRSFQYVDMDVNIDLVEQRKEALSSLNASPSVSGYLSFPASPPMKQRHSPPLLLVDSNSNSQYRCNSSIGEQKPRSLSWEEEWDTFPAEIWLALNDGNKRGIRRKVGWFALGLMGNNTIVEAPGDPLGFQYDCSLQRLFLPKWTTNLVATLLPKLRAQFGGERTLSLVPVQCFEVQEQFLRWWYTHSRHRAPLLTYHGTSYRAARSITKGGFKVMYGKGIYNGSAHGNGVYSTSDVSQALNYCRGVDHGSLFINAVVMDSCDAQSGNVYIVRDAARIVPLYVVHMRDFVRVGIHRKIIACLQR